MTGVVDLAALARAEGVGILWSEATTDLNLNLLAFEPGSAVPEHANSAVDVLLVGIEGDGLVTVDGVSHTLGPKQAIVIPKGTLRSIRCMRERFVYLTCHRRRGGLWPEQLRQAEQGPP